MVASLPPRLPFLDEGAVELRPPVAEQLDLVLPGARMIDLSRASSTSTSATSSSSLVASVSARRVPPGSTIWLRPQNSRRSRPTRFATVGRPGSRTRGRATSSSALTRAAIGQLVGSTTMSAPASARARVTSGSAGRNRSRSRSVRAACRKRVARRRGHEAVDAEEGQVGLAIRPDQAVRPDEHGGVAGTVAVTLEQPADDVDPQSRAGGRERLGGRPRDLLGKGQRLLEAVEDVARDRAFGNDE